LQSPERELKNVASEIIRSEVGTRGARRVAQHEVKKAWEALHVRRVSDEAVHRARKHLKKARAILRLLRPAMGDVAYARENAALRDAARPLSTVRDGKALLDQLEALVKRYGAPGRVLPLDPLRLQLQRERRESRRKLLRGPAALQTQRAMLTQVQARSARWRVGRHGWSVLGDGLKRIYGRGRNELSLVRAKRSTERLHEWRKQVKYLWHQLQLLQPLWPGLIGELADQAHQLADYLGDDHDLAVLRAKALASRELFPQPSARSALIALIDRCRTELQDKAIVLGERLYEEKPADFSARFGRYWSDWHHERG
jgi:CHAD domain-containing protein